MSNRTLKITKNIVIYQSNANYDVANRIIYYT